MIPRASVVYFAVLAAACFGSAWARPDVAPPESIADRLSSPAPVRPDAGASLDDAIDTVLPPESGAPSAPHQRAPNPRAVMKYASAYARFLDGNLAGAKSDAMESLMVDGMSIEPMLLLGRIETDLGRPLSARFYYEHALELDPTNQQVALALSADSLTLGNTNEALERVAPILRDAEAPEWMRSIVMDRAARSLSDLGYLVAAIEAARRVTPPAGAVPDWGRDYVIDALRSRGPLLVTLGDRALDTGDSALALALYDEAQQVAGGALPLLDTHRVYAMVVGGRLEEANALVIRRIEATRAADLETRALVRYLVANGGSREQLSAAIGAIGRAAERSQRALGASLRRLAAATMEPAQGIEALRRELSAHPTDSASGAELLRMIAGNESADSAWREAVAMVASDPWQGESVAESLISAIGDANESARLSTDDSSPAASLLAGLVQWRLGRERNANRLLEACAVDPALDGAAIAPAARLKFMLGRLDQAMGIIESVDPSSDEGVRRGVAEAYSALTLSDLAMETLAPAIAERADARTLYMAGCLHRERGEFKDAADCFESAWRADPFMHRAVAALLRLIGPGGEVLDESRAAMIVKEIRRTDPTSPVMGWLGVQAQLASDQPELAMRDLRFLLEEHPGEEAFLGALTDVMIASGQGGEAVRWLEHQIELQPGSTEAHLALARARVSVGSFDRAADALEDWLKRFPGDFAASELLERVYRDNLSLRLTSEEIAERRLARMPRTVDTVLEDLALRVSKKRLDEIPAVLDELRALSPEPSREVAMRLKEVAEELMLRSSLSDAQIRQAIDILDMIRRDFAVGSSPELLGLELTLAARTETSLELLLEHADRAEQSNILPPGEATVRLADAIREPGRPMQSRREMGDRRELALRLLRTAALRESSPLRINSEWMYRSMDAGDFESMGDALEHFGREGLLPAALDQLAASGRAAPFGSDWTTVMRWTASAMGQIGREEAQDVAYEGILHFDPTDASACNDLGYRLLERGEQIPRAIALIETAYRQNPDDAPTVDSMGWARYVQGRMSDGVDPETGAVVPGAITLLKRSIELIGDGIDENDVFNRIITNDHLGDAYWAIGDREAAVTRWDNAARLAEKLIETLNTQDMDLAGLELRAIVEASREKVRAVGAGEEPAVAPVVGDVGDPATITPPNTDTGEHASGRS